MWYVVYFTKSGKNVVLPDKWVRGLNDHMENFLNFRINTAQKFLFYFSAEDEAMDQGRPNENFKPKFHMNIDGVFPDEGCYLGNILKVRGKLKKTIELLTAVIYFDKSFSSANYEDAVLYAMKRRQVGAPIYNERRLFEKPIPNVAPEADPNADETIDDDEIEEPEVFEIENALELDNDDEIQFDPLQMSGESSNGQFEHVANDEIQNESVEITDSMLEQSIIEPNSEQNLCPDEATHNANIRPQIDSAVNNSATPNDDIHAIQTDAQVESGAIENDETQTNVDVTEQTQDENFSEQNLAQQSTEQALVDKNASPQPSQQSDGTNSNETASSANDAVIGTKQIENRCEQNSEQQFTEQTLAEENATVQPSQQIDGIVPNVDIKGEIVPLFEPIHSDAALQELLATPIDGELLVEEVDGMIITRVRGQIYQPLKSTTDSLIKHEMDIISGNLPFNEKVWFRQIGIFFSQFFILLLF